MPNQEELRRVQKEKLPNMLIRGYHRPNGGVIAILLTLMEGQDEIQQEEQRTNKEEETNLKRTVLDQLDRSPEGDSMQDQMQIFSGQALEDVRVKRGYEVGSDHYLLVATLEKLTHNNKLTAHGSKKEVEYLNITTYKLQDEEVQRRYQKEVTEEIDKSKAKGWKDRDIEELWQILKRILKSAAMEIRGIAKNTNMRKQTHKGGSQKEKDLT
ncbi:hypothetical protein ILUMI_26948 [Ignelater luminosus]|uniref:Uncharacterized protein n=1 Tax=Ignelater luminosus TaxID=2038154 RepID=A0A8K0C3X0_IGNLU|nr:hypothetical protein ILUMI_26948 [Ignelater luminosus]